MNKEELIGKLQLVYVGDKNALNELIGYYDGLKQGIEELQQENKKYKEVIDKAIKKINDYKIYCEKNKGFTEYTDIEIEAIEPVISKLEDILKEVSE